MQGCYVLLLALVAARVAADSAPSTSLRLLEKGTHLSRNHKHLVSDDSVSDGEEEASEYGPNGCVKTWLNEDGHCMIKTECKDESISDYEIKLICVDTGGERTRHVFNKGSFLPEEEFDTLIMCKECLGEEGEGAVAKNETGATKLPAADYSNATLADLVTEVTSMKAELEVATKQVAKLNEKVFEEEKPKTTKVLVHHTTEHHTVSATGAAAVTGAVSLEPVEHAQPAKRALRTAHSEEPKVEEAKAEPAPAVHSMAEAVALAHHKARHSVARHSDAPRERVVAKAQAEAVVTQTQTQTEEDSDSDDSEDDSSKAAETEAVQASSAETTVDSSAQEAAQASEGEQEQQQTTTDDSDSDSDSEASSAGQEESSDAEQQSSDSDSSSSEDAEQSAEREVEGREGANSESEGEESSEESSDVDDADESE